MAQQHTGRRALFGGAAALATVAAPTTGEATGAVAPHPDADLIAACARFEALEWQSLGYFYGPHRIKDDDEMDKANKPIFSAEEAEIDAIYGSVATTLDGHRARARAALVWEPDKAYAVADRWEESRADDHLSAQIEVALLRDLVGKEWLARLITMLDRGKLQAGLL